MARIRQEHIDSTNRILKLELAIQQAIQDVPGYSETELMQALLNTVSDLNQKKARREVPVTEAEPSRRPARVGWGGRASIGGSSGSHI